MVRACIRKYSALVLMRLFMAHWFWRVFLWRVFPCIARQNHSQIASRYEDEVFACSINSHEDASYSRLECLPEDCDLGLEEALRLLPSDAEKIRSLDRSLQKLEPEAKLTQCVNIRDALKGKYADVESVSNCYNLVFQQHLGRHILSGKEWDAFNKICRKGHQRLVATSTIGRFWGGDLVLDYGLTSKPMTFCRLSRTAAIKVPRWLDAVVIMNWSIYQRIQTTDKRTPKVNNTVCSIELLDLKRFLKFVARKRQPATTFTIPNGYVLDKYGLLVRERRVEITTTLDGPRRPEATLRPALCQPCLSEAPAEPVTDANADTWYSPSTPVASPSPSAAPEHSPQPPYDVEISTIQRIVAVQSSPLPSSSAATSQVQPHTTSFLLSPRASPGAESATTSLPSSQHPSPDGGDPPVRTDTEVEVAGRRRTSSLSPLFTRRSLCEPSEPSSTCSGPLVPISALMSPLHVASTPPSSSSTSRFLCSLQNPPVEARTALHTKRAPPVSLQPAKRQRTHNDTALPTETAGTDQQPPTATPSAASVESAIAEPSFANLEDRLFEKILSIFRERNFDPEEFSTAVHRALRRCLAETSPGAMAESPAMSVPDEVLSPSHTTGRQNPGLSPLNNVESATVDLSASSAPRCPDNHALNIIMPGKRREAASLTAENVILRGMNTAGRISQDASQCAAPINRLGADPLTVVSDGDTLPTSKSFFIDMEQATWARSEEAQDPGPFEEVDVPQDGLSSPLSGINSGQTPTSTFDQAPNLTTIGKALIEDISLKYADNIIGDIWYFPTSKPPTISLRLPKTLVQTRAQLPAYEASDLRHYTQWEVRHISLDKFQRLVVREGFGMVYWRMVETGAYVSMEVLDSRLHADFNR
ncbi:hypothetical protein L249_3329 [Ophiocordyceps polyrhachis-furcata BCC 54312]|uniref:Uncharacterized protein n=1 Tax=Ophiocordyceps polyrhachis-furcata BCC 54312 TaxID=1330021 RepID=A0A367LMV8_9HYPO|nr:hypothetical protein L249_3329 [Ophiocordyceps polyrhachis-furcata BCC 54312]